MAAPNTDVPRWCLKNLVFATAAATDFAAIKTLMLDTDCRPLFYSCSRICMQPATSAAGAASNAAFGQPLGAFLLNDRRQHRAKGQCRLSDRGAILSGTSAGGATACRLLRPRWQHWILRLLLLLLLRLLLWRRRQWLLLLRAGRILQLLLLLLLLLPLHPCLLLLQVPLRGLLQRWLPLWGLLRRKRLVLQRRPQLRQL